MHVYSILRGRPLLVKRFIEDCQDCFVDYKTSKGNYMVQLTPREVKLVEWIFPKEILPRFIKTLPPDNYGYGFAKGMLRKSLRLKKLPELDLTNEKPLLIARNGTVLKPEYVAVHHIGIKEDEEKNGIEQL